MTTIDHEIVVVSGLPRSGTSLMMQMLERGGMKVVTDELRVADADNPRGYYEVERIKKIKQDASWLAEVRGKAVKAISQLVFDLPSAEHYGMLWMQRDLNEVILSQTKMLARMGRASAPRDKLIEGYQKHVTQVHGWLAQQPNIRVLTIDYRTVIAFPAEEAHRVNEFLGGNLDERAMALAVDPVLYRNRTD